MIRKNILFVCLAVVALLSFAATNAGATPYMDEDFEGTSAFVDRDGPVRNYTSVPVFPLVQGINVRYWGDPAKYPVPGDPKSTDWYMGLYNHGDTFYKVSSMTNTGVVTSDRFFDGAKCLQLDSGQLVKPAAGSFPWRCPDQTRLIQFAVSTNASTANLTEGTQVGHFKIDYSTNGTDLTPEVTVTVNFVVNSSGGVDIIVDNNDTTIGTLTGQAGDWHMISVIAQGQLTDDGSASAPQEWRVYDYSDGSYDAHYKGPQPPNPSVPPTALNYATLEAGVHFFVDSDSTATATYLSYTDLGSNWGVPASQSPQQTYEIGWEIAAENGGTLFIDDMYWDGVGHSDPTNGYCKEEAARMEDFDKATTEPSEAPPTPTPLPAGVKSWDLYY